MKYRAYEIPIGYNKKHRAWSQQLIPRKLEELARAGVFYESRVLNEKEV